MCQTSFNRSTHMQSNSCAASTFSTKIMIGEPRILCNHLAYLEPIPKQTACDDHCVPDSPISMRERKLPRSKLLLLGRRLSSPVVIPQVRLWVSISPSPSNSITLDCLKRNQTPRTTGWNLNLPLSRRHGWGVESTRITRFQLIKRGAVLKFHRTRRADRELRLARCAGVQPNHSCCVRGSGRPI